MNARVSFCDPQARVLWIHCNGLLDEIEANLRAYCVDVIRGLGRSQLGLPYRVGFVEASRKAFGEAGATLVELLASRERLSKADEARFVEALGRVQEGQRSYAEATA